MENIPNEKLRWSLVSACREFGVSRSTLTQRLSESGTQIGSDGLYSTRQIVDALTSGLREQRLRKTREEANAIALKNEKMRREYLPADEVRLCLAQTVEFIRTSILASPLSEDTKRSILSHLDEIEIPGLEEQSRLHPRESI